jgi:hypothetical protein
MIVSEKYDHLTVALYSISTKISFEDVQTTTALLTQCTSNIVNVKIIIKYKNN